MLLRYVAIHGRIPSTEEEWSAYREWKKSQLDLPECKMDRVEGSPGSCEGCPGAKGCTKGREPR